MPATPAILMQRPGHLSWERQYEACQAYVDEHGYDVKGIVDNDNDAVALVQSGRAVVAVTAIAADSDEQLRDRLQAAGGRLEYCRTPHQRRRHARLSVRGHSTDELVVGAYERGSTVEQIHAVLGTPLERIRRILGRLGKRQRSDE